MTPTDTESAAPIRLVIVDDHHAFAEALSLAVGLESDIECVGTAPSVEEALRLAKEFQPDVVLMDVRLPDRDGIEGTAAIKQLLPRTRVVVLTGHADVGLMARAAQAGAAGFLAKESKIVDILRAIRTAGEGGMLIEPATLPRVLKAIPRPEPGGGTRYGQLTEREQEVLGLMGQGMDPQTIARQLSISLHTCRGHVKSILGKLGAHSQLEAVVVALRQGLLPGF